MSRQNTLSNQTRRNWLIDAFVFLGAVLAIVSSFYFLYWPRGGSPVVLLGRESWDTVHTWGGLLMIGAVLVHLTLHWGWIKTMARRAVSVARGRGGRFSRGAKVNIAVNLTIALSFLACAISGIYFYLAPEGGFQGGRNPGWDPGFLFSRTAWDVVHTWSGICLAIAAVIHFWIHWRWIVKTTGKLLGPLRARLGRERSSDLLPA
jgi:hypothetical protein